MQLASGTLDKALLEPYIGGDITLISTAGGSSSLVRGKLLGAEFNDKWVSVRLTCREFAMAPLESIDTAVWHQSSDSPTCALLLNPVRIDGEILVFTEPTPKGSTAIVTPLERQAA